MAQVPVRDAAALLFSMRNSDNAIRRVGRFGSFDSNAHDGTNADGGDDGAEDTSELSAVELALREASDALARDVVKTVRARGPDAPPLLVILVAPQVSPCCLFVCLFVYFVFFCTSLRADVCKRSHAIPQHKFFFSHSCLFTFSSSCVSVVLVIGDKRGRLNKKLLDKLIDALIRCYTLQYNAGVRQVDCVRGSVGGRASSVLS
jgi:hypothetical protein